MLLYYLFWMLIGFILHFYVIFGTNLLAGGPTQIVVFLPILGFEEKEYQTESEWNQTFRNVIFSTNMIQETWSGHQETTGQATRQGPSLLHRRTSSSYIYPRTPKHPGAPRIPNSTAATFCTREIPSRGLFRSSAGGGIDHGGPLHQLHGLSGDV